MRIDLTQREYQLARRAQRQHLDGETAIVPAPFEAKAASELAEKGLAGTWFDETKNAVVMQLTEKGMKV